MLLNVSPELVAYQIGFSFGTSTNFKQLVACMICCCFAQWLVARVEPQLRLPPISSFYLQSVTYNKSWISHRN